MQSRAKLNAGTLPRLLTYPVSRPEILLGKLAAHLAILTLAVVAGYGVAAVAAFGVDPRLPLQILHRCGG